MTDIFNKFFMISYQEMHKVLCKNCISLKCNLLDKRWSRYFHKIGIDSKLLDILELTNEYWSIERVKMNLETMSKCS